MSWDGELVAHNVYHIVNRAERNVTNGGEPHGLSLSCWCEPAVIPMGRDIAGRPVVVMNHHQRGLYCCSTHHPTGELPTFARVRTGRFCHIGEGAEAVQPKVRVTTRARIYNRPKH